jgi:hypothetical protein
MKIKKDPRSVLYSDPFQLQMPSSLGLTGGKPDLLTPRPRAPSMAKSTCYQKANS